MKKTEKRKSPLTERVEIISTPPQAPRDEGVDSDVLAYVNQFLQTPIPMMQSFSLATPEEAKKAVLMLERTQTFLNERRRTAQILKQMCEEQKEEPATGPDKGELN